MRTSVREPTEDREAHGSFPTPLSSSPRKTTANIPATTRRSLTQCVQSLLENTLCLIGFSGDDPNFLKWIGWIRDYFGRETVPMIYLVGVFDALTEADRKLLDRRSIVAVDLSEFSTNPGRALAAFLDYLRSRRTRARDWPVVSADARTWETDAKPENYVAIVAEWRHQRGEYPGWVVMPEDRRGFLWRATRHWLSHVSEISPTERADLGTPLDLELAFELAWRLERCLFPLTEGLAVFLADVASKYGDATVKLPEKGHWTTKSVFEAVADIRLWLLRHYREEGLVAKWEEQCRAIEDDFDGLLPEQKAKFRLEEVLHALFRFDPAEAKRLLVNWRNGDDLPFWEAKRAALLAELGEAAVAHSILEASLEAIRRQLSLNPVSEDYTLVSQESVVMYLLWAVKSGKSPKDRDSRDAGFLDELPARWNELSRYKCDPRRDVALLSARLGNRFERWQPESTAHSFDLGMYSRTIHFGDDEEAVAAFAMLRWYEDIGMPYRMERTTYVQAPVESTLLRVRPYSRHWALASMVRLGDAKATDGLFDREYLAGLKRDEIDGLLEIYLPAFERAIAMVNKPDRSDAKSFELLAKTLPEVLSRLCYKCSPEWRERLVGSLSAIYGSKRKRVFKGIFSFATRLFNSMSLQERAHVVPSLVDILLPDNQDETGNREFVNPVRLVNLHESAHGDALRVSPRRSTNCSIGSPRMDGTATGQRRHSSVCTIGANSTNSSRRDLESCCGMASKHRECHS